MLTSADFTSTETIESFQAGDNTIEIVGYVGAIEANLHLPRSESKFKKFLCCNGAGKRVQVTAWKEKIAKLDEIKLGHVVHVNSLKYNIPPNARYNAGNVPFELQIDDNSEVSVFDIHSASAAELAAEDVSILEAYNRLGKKIKLNAFMKTEPGIHKNQDFVSTVASVTNTVDEMEIKLNFDYKKLDTPLKMGIPVEVTGIVEKYPPGPPILRIDSPDDIVILEGQRVSFIDVINGFRVKGIGE